MPYQDWGLFSTPSNLGVCTPPVKTPTFTLPPGFGKDDGPSPSPPRVTTPSPVITTTPSPSPSPPPVVVVPANDGDDGPDGRWVTFDVYATRSRTSFDEFIDISISRPKIIQFTVTGLRPNTRHFVFYDGVDVTRYCKKDNTAEFAELARSSTYRNPGDKFIREDQFPDELGGPTAEIFSENDGSITGWFYLQRGQADSPAAGVQFATGQRRLQFCDISTLDPVAAVSYAEGVFVSDGGIETYTKTFYKVKTGTDRVWVPDP